MIASCPRCLNRYEVADDAAGKRATCPKCRLRFTIPGTAAVDPYTPGTPSATLENPFSSATEISTAGPPRHRRSWIGVGVLVVVVVVAVGMYLVL